jgi:hypothetical protein
MSNTLSKSNREARQVLSIFAGNLLQGAGFGLGCISLWFSTQPNSVPIRVTAMIAGYLLIYFNSHSSAHYLVGRLGGIMFSHYSVGGSSHASSYPPVMRQIFERLPFFTAHIVSQSLKSADPTAKALMFGAGIVSTVLLSSLAALFAFRADVPGALILLIFNVIWQVSSLIAEMRQGGDLAKAAKAFRSS